jgi:hypothetical protein
MIEAISSFRNAGKTSAQFVNPQMGDQLNPFQSLDVAPDQTLTKNRLTNEKGVDKLKHRKKKNKKVVVDGNSSHKKKIGRKTKTSVVAKKKSRKSGRMKTSRRGQKRRKNRRRGKRDTLQEISDAALQTEESSETK